MLPAEQTIVPVDRRHQAGDVRPHGGHRAFGIGEGIGAHGGFGPCRAQFVAQFLFVRLKAALALFERADRRGFFLDRGLEPVDRLGLAADFADLHESLSLEILDAAFELPRRHGEFRPHLILLGVHFLHRQRDRGVETAFGQAHGAAVHGRKNREPEKRGQQKSDAEIHRRFDRKRVADAEH